MNRLLILYKTSHLNNLSTLTSKYNNIYENVTSYFVLCDVNIPNNFLVDDKNHIIRIKIKENNWESLLIKIIQAFQIFKNKKYTHIMVTNVSTFVNIPILYNLLSDDLCCGVLGYNYNFKNIVYNWPSGAGYILHINLVKELCDFFNKNNYIINNKLSNDFCKNFPTTDDIFIGYYLKLNNIHIRQIVRSDIISKGYIIKKSEINNSHFRIKTGAWFEDYIYHRLLNNYINILDR